MSRRLWHAHAGDLDQESLADTHAGSGEEDSDRVAVLHVWVPQPNPAGTFANNDGSHRCHNVLFFAT